MRIFKVFLAVIYIALIVHGVIAVSGCSYPTLKGLPPPDEAPYCFWFDGLNRVTAKYEIKDNVLYLYGYWGYEGETYGWKYIEFTLIRDFKDGTIQFTDRRSNSDWLTY